MGRRAAIFDLDRTLLRGASGPVISDALRREGLLRTSPLPGEGILFAVYDLLGETRAAMILTRRFAAMASGWDRSRARAAGRLAASVLADAVQPFARATMAAHRDAGDQLVLATTTPLDLIEPLAEELGFDAVIATRYGESHGAYTGKIDGEFVWGEGKLRAVSEWSEDAGVDLSDSAFYTDSYYDVPLLEAVGHPVVVNPDPRLLALATLRRWPVVHFDVPPGVPKILGVEPQSLVQWFARPQLLPFVRFDLDGLPHVPREGPAIIAANHRSYFDPLAIGYALAQVGRPVRFLGKREVFDAPVVGQVARALGGIRVERGSGSDEPLEAAARALGAGELVAIMPQGTIPRGPAFFEPELRGRWGAARLAELTGAPVIPLGLWGTEKVWPRNARLPNITNVVHPPTVRMRFGPPVELSGVDLDVKTKSIMAAIVGLLPSEARVRIEPSPEQLAATLPPGQRDAPSFEDERRR